MVAFSSDGKTLASDAYGGTITFRDVATRKTIVTFGEPRQLSIFSVAFSPDGKTLAAVGCDLCFRVWRLPSNKEADAFLPNDGAAWGLAFSPDGKTLAVSRGDGSIQLYAVATGNRIATLKRHDGWIYTVAFSPDGKTLASGSGDKTIKLWNIATAKEAATLKGHKEVVSSVAFSPNGKTLASGSAQVELGYGTPPPGTRPLPSTGIRSSLFSGVQSWTGNTLVFPVVKNATIKLWDVASGKNTAIINGHTEGVLSVALPGRSTSRPAVGTGRSNCGT